MKQALFRIAYSTLCAVGRPFGGVRPRRLYDLLGRRAYPVPEYRWRRNRWGDELLLSPSFHIDRNILVFGTYDEPLHRYIERHVQRGTICMDVGANLGEMSLHMARRTGAGGKVYAFEPVPHVFERLRGHVLRNGVEGVVEAVPVAFADQTGEREIAFAADDADNQGLASLVNLDRHEISRRAVVRTSTLDEFARHHDLHRLDLVKVDIQGAEPEFLAGGKETLRRLSPDLVMEISPGDLAASGKSSRDLCETIESLGYRIYTLSDAGRRDGLIRAATVGPDFAAVNVVCSHRD